MPHPEQAAADAFKMLADLTRLRVLLLLDGGELHVGALSERVGQTQPALSHHLALLRVSGLVDCRRAGKRNLYHLTPRSRPLVKAARRLVPAPAAAVPA